MSDFEKYYQAADFSEACRSALAAEKARRQSGSLTPGPGHAMHLTFAARVDGDDNTLGILTLPQQPVKLNPDGRYTYGWGPVPVDSRTFPDNAGDPEQPGAYIVYDDGSWGQWQKGVGFVAGQGVKPLAVFDSSGICTKDGFTRGGVWYTKGDANEHPSNGGKAPGAPVAGGASVVSLATELLARAKELGV